MRWSQWVPWLRRRHPLSEPVRPFRVTGYPDVPRVAGTAEQDQGKPDARPLIYPGGFLRPVELIVGPQTGGQPDPDDPAPDSPFGPVRAEFVCDCPPFRHTVACYEAWRAAGRPPFRRRTEGER